MSNLLSNAEQDMVIRMTIATVLGLSAMFGFMLVVSGGAPAQPATTYIYDNSTVFVNTTNTTTVNHWVNTTTFINTSTSTTIYVNHTYVVSIPVVVVTSLTVDFANGTSVSTVLPTNYSLPVGTVTWVQFEMTGTPSYLNVNAPWTLLSFSASATHTPPPLGPTCGHGPETVTVLIGVPYTAGVDAMVLTVNAPPP